MKIHISVTLGLCMLLSMLASCRKGENDPFFSLRSRKDRVAGTWSLSSGSGSSSESNVIIDWSFDGSVKTVNTTTIGRDTIRTSTSDQYQLLCTFEKDGSFVIVEKEGTSRYATTTTRGKWNFTDGERSRSRLLLSITSVEESGGSTYYEGSECPHRYFDIDELRNKKMVIMWDGRSTDRGAAATDSGTWVLEQ